MENDDRILCPLVNELIDPVDCMENQDIKDCYVPDKFKKDANWRDVCKNCKYYDY